MKPESSELIEWGNGIGSPEWELRTSVDAVAHYIHLLRIRAGKEWPKVKALLLKRMEEEED